MKIGAAILMGGNNSRMEGNIKGLLKIGDITFLEKIQNVLIDFQNIYLSINKKFSPEDIKKYEDNKLSVIVDDYDDIGPMGGIYSCLKYCKEDYLFITACDMPFINQQLINTLISNLNKDIEVIIFSQNGLYYPLGAIYSKKVIPKIEELINNKEYKLLKLVKESNFIELKIEDMGLSSEIFKNINTPVEYKEIMYGKY